LDSPDSHIALDDNIHFIKKEYLRAGGENNSIDNLASDFVTKLLGEKKDEFTVWYKNYQGFMTVSVGNVSVIANGFLSKNHEYDFFIDVSPKGNISLRSSNKADVCEIAKTVFNGGGHKNASGGRANNIKDFYTYSEYKKTIDEIFRKAEGI
jgi:oligoribonuclease NrnB/cAMP/cGMP phosphodiesterase (DHH superfamily)